LADVLAKTILGEMDAPVIAVEDSDESLKLLPGDFLAGHAMDAVTTTRQGAPAADPAAQTQAPASPSVPLHSSRQSCPPRGTLRIEILGPAVTR